MSSTLAYTYTLSSASSTYSSAPASPNAFSLFSIPQSPRDTHMMYEDFRQGVFGSSNQNGIQRKRTESSGSLKKGLKKIFGGM